MRKKKKNEMNCCESIVQQQTAMILNEVLENLSHYRYSVCHLYKNGIQVLLSVNSMLIINNQNCFFIWIFILCCLCRCLNKMKRKDEEVYIEREKSKIFRFVHSWAWRNRFIFASVLDHKAFHFRSVATERVVCHWPICFSITFVFFFFSLITHVYFFFSLLFIYIQML